MRWLRSVPWMDRLQAASYICSTVALAALFFQMHSDGAARRAERSLNYAHQYSSEPLSTHRVRLEQAWLPYAKDIAASNAAGGLSPAGLNRVRSQVMLEHDQKHPDHPAILSVVEIASFYDQVLTCVEVKACDRSIAQSYFDVPMREFWTIYAPEVREARTWTSASLGVQLEAEMRRR